jgi:two-component system, NarL family, sensor histidine kinase DesK
MRRELGLTGLRRYTWWTVPGTTACLLALFIGSWTVGSGLPPWAQALVAVALGVEVTATVILLGGRLSPEPGSHRSWLIAGGLAAAVLAVVILAEQEYGLWVVAPAVMAVIWAETLPAPHRWRVIGAAMLLGGLHGGVIALFAGDGAELAYAVLFPPGLIAFTAWTILGPLWVWDTAARLNEARRLAAELAIADERLRFAADLHDIQGHHLQVIALKSELAARLVPRDPARAAAEMEEVRHLAAEALRDTRAVVLGYRRTTLDEEIGNATKVLAAAGIETRLATPEAAVALPDPVRHLLGLVMREATTNVLRHSSGAQQAEIAYRVGEGRARLEVGNDGVSPGGGGDPGTGLTALAERLRAAGGELVWEHDGARFVLTACLPVGGPSGSERFDDPSVDRRR